MDRLRAIGIGCSLLLLATPLFGADVYKWKDANAVTTYSQVPPAQGIRAERLQTSGSGTRRTATQDTSASAATTGGPATTPGAAGRTPEETPAQRAMREQLDAEEKTRMAQLAATRTQECERARAQFDQLTQFARMRVQDEAGNVRVMPEEERQQLIKETKGRIVEFCGS